MKQIHPRTTHTVVILWPLTWVAWLRDTGSRLIALAMSLASFAQVFGQPTITSQPTVQIATPGETATFTVTATGTLPLAYQWRFNDSVLAGKTNRTLVLANVQAPNAGNYSVLVANASGSVTSRLAGLMFTTVHRFGAITAKPDRSISLNLAGVVPKALSPYYDLYPLEASTNLMDWTPSAMLQRTNDSTDALSYHDPDARNFDERFYRTPTNFLVTPFPKPSGPYPVGTVSRLLTDPSRTNRYSIRTNSSFMVTFWYPAEARAGVLPEAYLENNSELFDYLNARSANEVAQLRSQALPGLALATNETSYPVLLNPGGVTRRQNTDKALELASHGYVVAAVDSADCTASVFPSGQVVHGPLICAATHACFQPTLDNGIKDLQFVADELSRINTNDPLFAGRLDLERLGVFGYSVKCVIAAEYCRIDARCKAVVLLDCGPTLDLGTNLTQLGLQKPFLSINSTTSLGPVPPPLLGGPQIIPGSSEWLASSIALFSSAADNAFWFQLQDSGHQSFQDRGSLISDPTLTDDPTPVSRAHSRTIRACTLSFFDKYLKGEDDHLFDKPSAVYPNIINFQKK